MGRGFLWGDRAQPLLHRSRESGDRSAPGLTPFVTSSPKGIAKYKYSKRSTER